MLQILSYTSRPANNKDPSHKTCTLFRFNCGKKSLLTKCVKDISDENKFAGVELDHRIVGQKLGALQHRSQIRGDIY